MDIFISPIRAVLDQLNDQSVNYILCTSSEQFSIEQKVNVLVLRFMDVDESRPDAFQKRQAEAVCRFLLYTDSTKDLFVCCDDGTSRSAAIAAAITLSQKQSDLWIWRDPEYHPNLYVFKLQCIAFGIDISNDEVLMRKKVNEDSFHSAIQRRFNVRF